MPLPLPTNTPLPTTTDCLLPMITLGCGDARLARVPSGQMIASPVKMPRRPSSQVTSVPWRVQFCAMAEETVATAAAETRRENTSARVIIATVPYWSLLADLAFALLSRRRTAMFGSKRTPNGSAAEPNYAIIPTNWGNFWHGARPPLQNPPCPVMRGASGEMAEWLKAHAWKACVRETVPWVRIPLSPPVNIPTSSQSTSITLETHEFTSVGFPSAS